jgi:UDP-3-O-[3-hydroxymyristoyl] N-acetylglucosamine deacetylase
VGIHSGRQARVHLHRSEGALCFRVGGRLIPARVHAVADTSRCTILAAESVRIAVVEHLLAACHALGFWSGLTVEVDGDELPILDGSSLAWVEALQQLPPPPPAPAPLQLTQPLHFEAGATRISFIPGPTGFDVGVDFPHPAIGAQRWSGGPNAYQDLMSARTFGFAHELAALRAAGLAQGASLQNGILFTDAGPAVALRWPDEPVRHKALDALGDFALLGAPVAATVRIERGSHRAHVAAMQLLSSSPTLIKPGSAVA